MHSRPSPATLGRMGVRLVVVVSAALLALPSTAAAAARDVQMPDGAVYRSGLTGRYFHPLGSFGKLNRAVTAGDRRRAQRMADALIARGSRQGRFGLVWYYNVPGGRSGWTSGLAQAVAAQALARAGRKSAARRAFLPIPQRLVTQLPQGPWIKLYGYSDAVVLNAQLQAALSLGEYARLTNDERARRLARDLRRTARVLLPRFDTGSWSRYALGGQAATLEYHAYVTALLWRLSARQAGGRWRVYANRFSRYRRLPPVLRRGRPGAGGPARARRLPGLCAGRVLALEAVDRDLPDRRDADLAVVRARVAHLLLVAAGGARPGATRSGRPRPTAPGTRPFSACRGCVWARTPSRLTSALRWPATDSSGVPRTPSRPGSTCGWSGASEAGSRRASSADSSGSATARLARRRRPAWAS